jgi:Galactose oxidase, central domain
MVLDTEHEQLIAFGGEDNGFDESNETWVKPTSSTTPWSKLMTNGLAPPRMVDHTSIYDPLRHRMIVLGGGGSDTAASLWALTLSGTPEWKQMDAQGEGPRLRYGARAIYDPNSDCMLVFGGYSVPGDTLANDVWSLSLNDAPLWTRLLPGGTWPTKRSEGAVVYDSTHERLVIFGGWPQHPQALNDVWALSLVDSLQWTELQTAGGLPPALYDFTYGYDSVHDRLIVFGGINASPEHELWALQFGDSNRWSPIDIAGPKPMGRLNARAVYDAARDRLVVFGGTTVSRDQRWAWDSVADTWALALGGVPAWVEMEPGDDGSPDFSVDQTATYDLAHHRVLELGGWNIVYGSGSESFWHRGLWQFTFEPRHEWHSVVRDSSPPALNRHSMVIDPIADRLLLYGGNLSAGFETDLAMEDRVWELPLSEARPWHVIDAGAAPPGRCSHSAIYDPLRRRMLVYGGQNETAIFDDVWALSLDGDPRWSRIDVEGQGPGARSGHSAVYDPIGDRMIVFGGWDGSSLHDDTWQLALSGTPVWQPLPSVEHPPAEAAGSMMSYDSRRKRLVLFQSGPSFDPGPGEVWLLPLAPGAGWQKALVPGEMPHSRTKSTSVYAPDHDRFVLLQGSLNGNGGYNTNADHDIWLMASSVIVPAVPTLSRLEASPWRVLLRWVAAGEPPANAVVERRMIGTPWSAISAGPPEPDGLGLTFIDRTAAPRERYAYRLSWSIGAAAQVTPEVWVDVPALRFALAPGSANPSSAGLSAKVSLIDGTAAKLEVMDVAGRRLLAREVGFLGPGDHVIELARPGVLSAGVYLVRLSRPGEARVMRTAVLR